MDDTTTIECVYLHETGKAVLVDIDGDETWIPLSVTDYAENSCERGDSLTLEVKTWWAEKEGLA